MGGSNAPDTPEPVVSTYNNGFGGTSTTKMVGNNQSTTYTPSDFENQQYGYYKTVTPQLQSKLYDQAGAESGAESYAGNIRAQGLKRFGIDQADALGGAQASNARRFGSLSNSDYDSQMKTFAREANSGLADIESQYDTNKSNYINDYNNRYTNLLGTMNGIYNNANTNANTMNNGSTNGYQVGNAFNQTRYNNQMTQYQMDQARKQQMYDMAARAAIGLGTAGAGAFGAGALEAPSVGGNLLSGGGSIGNLGGGVMIA